jgi:hypothetical protein
MKKDMIMTVFMIGLLLIIRDDTWLNKEAEIQAFFQNFLPEQQSIGLSFEYEAGLHDYGIAYFANGAMSKLRRASKEQWTPEQLAIIKAKIQAAIDANKAWIGDVEPEAGQSESDAVQAKCESLGLTKKEEPAE